MACYNSRDIPEALLYIIMVSASRSYDDDDMIMRPWFGAQPGPGMASTDAACLLRNPGRSLAEPDWRLQRATAGGVR